MNMFYLIILLLLFLHICVKFSLLFSYYVKLKCITGYQNPSMLPGALSHVMMRPMTDRQLAALVEVAHFQQDQDCFAQAVMLSLRSCLELEVGKPVHLWVNLEKLLR